MSRPRFHLAFPVTDLQAARHFYGQVLGCPEGRASDHWIDFDLFGHDESHYPLAPESHMPADHERIEGRLHGDQIGQTESGAVIVCHIPPAV